MANCLIAIGWLGIKRVYLNLTREEALARYRASEGESCETDPQIEEIEFEDEFWAYDVGRSL
jgi:hypothetical protein